MFRNLDFPVLIRVQLCHSLTDFLSMTSSFSDVRTRIRCPWIVLPLLLVGPFAQADETKDKLYGRADYSNSSIASDRAGGVVGGQLFVHASARVRFVGYNRVKSGAESDKARCYWLTFSQAAENEDGSKFVVIIATDAKSVEGQVFKVKPFAFSEPGWGDQYFNHKGKRRMVALGITGANYSLGTAGKTEMFGEKITGRVEFGKRRSNGKIPGKIILVLPDKSYVTGTFQAKAEKF